MRRRDFFLSAATAAAQPRTDYELSAAGKRLAALHAGPEFDKPFLYPIHTPAGKVLSRGFPLAPAPGESNDHGWHRGFFYGHGIVNGHDFWRELGRDKTSRLVTDPTTILHKRGQLSFASSMVTPSGDAIGTVSKRYAARATGPMFLLEASINISANRGQPLTFGDTDDGGFAFRLADAFREDRGARLLNSEGRKGTAQMWGQPARWIHYEADLPAGTAGVAVLDHPANLRHPTRWHARGYSLCAANPFALRSFSRDKSADGSYTLPAGQTLTLRYLVLIHDGPLDGSSIEARFKSFAR